MVEGVTTLSIGMICPSVVNTILAEFIEFSSSNIRYKYLRVSDKKKLSIRSSCLPVMIFTAAKPHLVRV